MTKSIKSSSDGDGAQRSSKREASQATLSAIGDVSVAATEAVGRVAAAPRKTRWLPIIGFLLLVYIAGSMMAIYTHESPPWVQAFAAPLLLVLIATLAFWRRQMWKFRACEWRFKEKVRQDALNSLAHETANGLNAIRANLAGFDEAESLPAATAHLKQVEQALERIDAALAKAIRQTPPKPASGSKPASASR
jgi:predicted lipid-binding transport protein (Tim44 family)